MSKSHSLPPTTILTEVDRSVMSSPDSLSPASAGHWRPMRSPSPEPRGRSPEPRSPMSPTSSRTRDKILAPFKNASRSRLVDPDESNDVPLTEEELREIFEEEEIQRFLQAFHTHVGEVTLPTSDESYGRTSSRPPVPQKVVIVPPEDVDAIAQVNAVPPSAAIEPLPGSLAQEIIPPGGDRDATSGESDSDDEGDWSDNRTESEEMWVDVAKESTTDPTVFEPEEALPSKTKHVHVDRPPPVWGSERAAAFIVPLLPQGRAIEARNRRGGKHDRFTLTGLRVAGQRAYLAIYPFYVPFLLNLWDLSRWIDWWRSARLCALYWLLWAYDLLLPAFLFYLVFELVKHRVLPYPTREQLEARRRAVREAEDIGEAFISISSHAGPWRSSERYTGLGSLSMGIAGATAAAQAHAEAMRVSSIMKMAMGAGKGALTGRFKKDKYLIDPETKMSTVEGDQLLTGADARHAADWRRLAVLLIEELADLHERAKNLFLWRRPDSSLSYSLSLAGAAVVVTFTPAHYLTKATYAGLGFFFWFGIPTLCAMTRKQRSMIPPPLWDVPTDAEYAMEIIAQRLAQGQSVTPDKKGAKKLSEAYGSRSAKDLALKNTSGKSPISPAASTASIGAAPSSPREPSPLVRASPVQDGLLRSATTVGPVGAFPETKGSLNVVEAPTGSQDASVGGSTEPPADPGLSFSAHHKHLPGILRLTNTCIEFTPFLKHHPTLHIDLDRIRGVKKVGHFRGLLIRYIEPVRQDNAAQGGVEGYQTVDNPEPVIVMMEKEEKLKWIGSRDEVFARIVASRGKSWVPV